MTTTPKQPAGANPRGRPLHNPEGQTYGQAADLGGNLIASLNGVGCEYRITQSVASSQLALDVWGIAAGPVSLPVTWEGRASSWAEAVALAANEVAQQLEEEGGLPEPRLTLEPARLITDPDADVSYHAHTGPNGERGFRAVDGSGREAFVLLNPSGGSDDGVPTVFLYCGPDGDASRDAVVTYVGMFDRP